MWVERSDGFGSEWRTAWVLLLRALTCALLGHRGLTTWDTFPGGGLHFRVCRRCWRQWDWVGPPPAHLVEMWKGGRRA